MELHDLDLVSNEHETGEREDVDEESIKAVETEILISSQDHTKTKSGCIIKIPAQYIDEEFEMNLMNSYILIEKLLDESTEFATVGASIGGGFQGT